MSKPVKEMILAEYQKRFDLPAADPLVHGVEEIVAALESGFPEAFS